MKKHWRRFLIAGLIIVVIVTIGVIRWKHYVLERTDKQAMDWVTAAVNEGAYRKAATMLQVHMQQDGKRRSQMTTPEWLRLRFAVALGSRDMAELNALATAHPEVAEADERACLWLYRVLHAANQPTEADRWREIWRGRERMEDLWTLAEVDVHLHKREVTVAGELLRTARLSAARAESDRFIRLALLAQSGEERQKWFSAAYAADPTNADLRHMRAQFLERAGASEAARIEYVAAYLLDSTSPIRRLELAGFYQRQRNFGMAVQTLGQQLSEWDPDEIWREAFFWAWMTAGAIPNGQKIIPSRQRRMADFIEGLHSALPMPSVEAVSTRTTAQRQWLSIIHLLRAGREETVLIRMEADQARLAGIDAELAAAMRHLLHLRLGRPIGMNPPVWPEQTILTHPLLMRLRQQNEDSGTGDWDVFIRSDNAVAGVLLACGWQRAALHLTSAETRSAAAWPDWFVFGMGRAKHNVEGAESARNWLTNASESPLQQLLLGELELVTAKSEQGMERLKPLMETTDSIGYRAAWLVINQLLNQQRYVEADAMYTLPSIAGTSLQAEWLARQALRRGDRIAALRLYSPHATESLEAGIFVIAEALAAKELQVARELALIWASRMPDNPILRENLRHIEAQLNP